MKEFYRKTIASCLSLVVLFLTIGPAAASVANETLQIRGPIYNGTALHDILTKNVIKMDADNYAVYSPILLGKFLIRREITSYA
jgi:hypothetical protein